MKRLLLCFGILHGIPLLYSQSLSPQVIASSGNSFSSVSARLEFTIGEVAISTLTIGSNTFTQGFHQSEIHYASMENYNTDYVFTLYPNPTEQFVTVVSTKEEDMQVHLYDVNGRAILVSSVFQQKITIDMQTLSAGSYIIRITKKSGEPLHSYTVIKKSNY